MCAPNIIHGATDANNLYLRFHYGLWLCVRYQPCVSRRCTFVTGSLTRIREWSCEVLQCRGAHGGLQCGLFSHQVFSTYCLRPTVYVHDDSSFYAYTISNVCVATGLTWRESSHEESRMVSRCLCRVAGHTSDCDVVISHQVFICNIETNVYTLY